jgi:thermostable 8-oxoguanine DNA glycosylase
MFTKVFLAGVRREALRKRVWYKALDSLERGILSIASKIIDSVRSMILDHQIVKIIAKLKSANKCDFIKHFERYGMERGRIIQSQAYSFGYVNASGLLKDIGFIKYLAFLDYHQPMGWRIHL